MGVERINELGCPSWRKFSPELAPDDVIGSLYVHGLPLPSHRRRALMCVTAHLLTASAGGCSRGLLWRTAAGEGRGHKVRAVFGQPALGAVAHVRRSPLLECPSRASSTTPLARGVMEH